MVPFCGTGFGGGCFEWDVLSSPVVSPGSWRLLGVEELYIQEAR